MLSLFISLFLVIVLIYYFLFSISICVVGLGQVKLGKRHLLSDRPPSSVCLHLAARLWHCNTNFYKQSQSLVKKILRFFSNKVIIKKKWVLSSLCVIVLFIKDAQDAFSYVLKHAYL